MKEYSNRKLSLITVKEICEKHQLPGHADGLYAVKVKNDEGKFVLLFSDGGYARKSWEEMITSGIAADKKLQKQSLEWIREQSLDKNCIESVNKIR